MNERLKAIRLFLNLSQEEFGEKINIKSRAHISSLENGTRNLTERIVNDICREFKVSEHWLRTGKGEMFVSTPDDELERLAVKYNLSDLAKRVVGEFVKLDKDQSDVVLGWLKNIFSEPEAGTKTNATYNNKIHLAAAHNENLDDPEELEKIRRDLDKL